MSVRTYSDLIRLSTFAERLRYATLSGTVGEGTFFGRRVLNQSFYRSAEWKRARDAVIVRDLGCDLGCRDRPIVGKIVVHHLNPITPRSLNDIKVILDPELMVCVSLDTHNLIHYGTIQEMLDDYTPRSQNDTCLWR